MSKKYLVISQFAEEKEMCFWWENINLQHYSADIFMDFESAKAFMRKQISEMFADFQDTLIKRVFGDDAEREADFDEESEIAMALAEMFGFGDITSFDERVKKIKTVTQSIIRDETYIPECIEEIKVLDDADHYHAFVYNDNIVVGYNDGLCIEYNIHKMDNEDFYYYFNVYSVEDEQKQQIASVKLINTEKNVDNSAVEMEDHVDCKQIKFGVFVQDENKNAEAERILWDVIDEKDDKLLVVSHKCLDYRIFNDGRKNASWGKSELRRWLNGEFLDEAFSEEEKKKILLAEVSNGRAKKTEDFIFLLSEDEYRMLDRNNRKAFLTKYARARFSEKLGYRYTEPYGFWWLRSRGVDVKNGYDVIHVCANGALNGFARSDSSHPNGIRPAMWIKK